MVQAGQQVCEPALFAAHHMTTGEFGHCALVVQVSEHHPGPDPPLTHRPLAHSLLSMQGAPRGWLVHAVDGPHTWLPCDVVVQQPLVQLAFEVQVSAQRPPDPKSVQKPRFMMKSAHWLFWVHDEPAGRPLAVALQAVTGNPATALHEQLVQAAPVPCTTHSAGDAQSWRVPAGVEGHATPFG